MNVSFREPTLTEILSDPVIKAVMQADSVDPSQLEIILREVADQRRTLQRRSQSSEADFAA